MLIVLDGAWGEFDAGILAEGSQEKEGILGLDAEFFDFNFVGGADAVAEQKAADVGGDFFFGGEERVAVFLLEVAMEIEFGAAGVDQDFAGKVVEKERHVHALGGDLHPLVVLALALPLPDQGAEVITRVAANGGEHGKRAGGEAGEFDHAHGRTADAGSGRVENQLPALQQAEALIEQEKACADSEDAEGDGLGATGAKEQEGAKHQSLSPGMF